MYMKHGSILHDTDDFLLQLVYFFSENWLHVWIYIVSWSSFQIGLDCGFEDPLESNTCKVGRREDAVWIGASEEARTSTFVCTKNIKSSIVCFSWIQLHIERYCILHAPCIDVYIDINLELSCVYMNFSFQIGLMLRISTSNSIPLCTLAFYLAHNKQNKPYLKLNLYSY